mgnify:CR=1 FL=1
MDLIFDLFWPFVSFLGIVFVVALIVLPDMGRLMLGLVFALPLIIPYRLITGDKAMPPKDRIICFMVLIFCGFANSAQAGRWSHNALVRESGISPRQVGSYEGVGMSTRSYIDARNNACYWGKRTPLSIQYSYRNGRYYAVVRYQ